MSQAPFAPCNIVVFASGNGTNAERLIRFFGASDFGRVCLVVTNNPNAGVIERAGNLEVPVAVISNAEARDGAALCELMEDVQADLVVLAGYLKLIPEALIAAFPSRIVNIHPALLPAYGGKGMYGAKVHEAVLKNEEATSGITIHYVTEHYDEGEIIFQKHLEIQPGWEVADLQAAIHQLEHAHFPVIVERLCQHLLNTRVNA